MSSLDERFETIDRVYRRLGADVFGAPSLVAAVADRDPDEQAFVVLVMCGGEIDNGGFAQLFTNSTGELANVAIASAERFGLDRHAALLRDAVALFPGNAFPTDFDHRYEQWNVLCEQMGDELDARLETLDQRWYAPSRRT
jgi:hypothetical protein